MFWGGKEIRKEKRDAVEILWVVGASSSGN